MTSETYMALSDCAQRRIEHEWACSAAERAVLGLVRDLSFALGQTWALVPCLGDFAAVLDIHKSTVSRALRSALKKGYLLVLQRRDETLYSICTETRGAAKPADAGKAGEVRARLVKMNETRLQGHADGDGQIRLPGVLPSEETEAPARAFVAMMEGPEQSGSFMPEYQPQSGTECGAFVSKREVSASVSAPRETTAPTPMRAMAGDGDGESDLEFQQRLEGMVKAAEASREREQQVPSGLPRAPTSDASNLDKEMVKLCRGLDSGARHIMERLREEFASGGKLQEAQFFKWGPVWRSRAKAHPRQCAEVAGEHKNMRLISGPAKEPGAWMYRALQELTSVNAG